MFLINTCYNERDDVFYGGNPTMTGKIYFNEPETKIFEDIKIYDGVCHGFTVTKDTPKDFSVRSSF